MAIRLIATDLDGTLLGRGAKVSARTRAAIVAARQAGIDVVPVTGRGFRTALDVISDAGVDEVVCSNGALNYDLVLDQIREVRAIEGDTFRSLVSSLRAELPELNFGWETTVAVTFEPGFAIEQWSDVTTPEPIAEVAEAIKVFVGHPNIFEADLQHRLLPLLPEGMFVSTSGAPFVEMTAAGADKAAAVQRLAAARGIDRAEVMTFGDQMNDLSMLEWAGVGVAMGNARPEAKAVADRVTTSNVEDGVAAVIEELLAAQS